MSHRRVFPALAAWVFIVLSGPVGAQELRLAVKSEIDSADPHVAYGPNRAVLLHVYEGLLRHDAGMRTRPHLAESWTRPDPLTWRFTLRAGVRFHDGTPLRPEDVVFSLRRAQKQPGPRTYAAALRAVSAIEADGPRDVVVRTTVPVANQPALLATIPVVSAHAAPDAGPDDWNGGRAAVGTGPYRWVRWTPGQGVALARNPSYWGGTEPWDTVTIRFVPSDAARMATLLAREVDVADAVPGGLRDRLREAGLGMAETNAILTDYLSLDTTRPTVPPAGPPNPLRDGRVREALSRAINRDALARQAMQGGASPAGQFAAPGLPGHDAALRPDPYDAGEARRLLAEAGYPGGFDLPLGCAAERFAGDAAVCQAVVQMLAGVGVRPRLDLLPVSVFLRRLFASGGPVEWGAAIAATGSPSGLTLEWMNTILHSPAPERGQGAGNPGFTAVPALDALLDAAATAGDAEVQAEAVSEATRFAVSQRLILPLLFLKAGWGHRPDLTVEPRADGATLATGIRVHPP